MQRYIEFELGVRQESRFETFSSHFPTHNFNISLSKKKTEHSFGKLRPLRRFFFGKNYIHVKSEKRNSVIMCKVLKNKIEHY